MLDLESRIAESLTRIRAAHSQSYEHKILQLREAILRKTRRRRRSRAGLAAATVIAIVAALVVLPENISGRDAAGPAAGERTLIKIPTGAPSHITASGDNVWLVSPTELRRIDAETNRLATLVRGFTPDDVSDIVADADIVWVVRKDNRFGIIESINEFGAGLQGIGRFNTELVAVDIADGYGWGADAATSSVWRINTRTGAFMRRYRTGIEPRLEGSVDLVAGDGYIWLLAAEDLVRIDPEGFTEAATTTTVNRCAGLAVGEGAVWVLDSCRDVVTRYDPETLDETGTIDSEGRDFGERIVIGLGSLWITGDSVTRIDPSTNRIVGPPIEVDGGASEIAAGDDSLWMATPHGVLRYTPEGVQPTEETPRGGVLPRSALGMWPEIVDEEAAEACDRRDANGEDWRTKPDRLVARFAKLELGLTRVSVQEVARDRFAVTLRITSSRNPRFAPPFLATWARVRPVPRSTCWVVESLGPSVDGMNMTQDPRDDGTFVLDMRPPLPVHQIGVELGQIGRPPINLAAAPSDFPIEIDGYRPEAPGYLLLRFYRDAHLVSAYAELLD